MSGAAELMAECAAQGILLAATADGGLSIDARQVALTPELAERLKAHKPAILAALWSRPGEPLFPPFVMEGLRAAEVELDEDPELAALCEAVGPDGWPINSIDPADVRPCATCGGPDLWQDVTPGNWHCAKCDPPEKRSSELLRKAAAIRSA